jgi:hypothetical protein
MGILFTHPIRTFQQYSKNALGMLIFSEQVVIFYHLIHLKTDWNAWNGQNARKIAIDDQ